MAGINQTQVLSLGTAAIVLGTTDLGLVAKDIKLTLKNAKVDLMAAYTGKAPVAQYTSTPTAEIDFTLVQTDFGVLSVAFPQTNLVSNASGSAVTFGNFSGERLTAMALSIIPRTGPFANYSLKVSQVIPIGSPVPTWDPSAGQVWAVKLEVIANPTALDGNVLGITFGNTTITQQGGFVPTVFSPANGTSGYSLTGTYAVTFSNPVNQNTVVPTTFLLTTGTSAGTTAVSGTISFPSSSGILFTPANAYATGVTYNALISSTIQDAYGNSLPQFYTTSFVA